MLDQIEAVIFDLDGTLMDSMSLWNEIDIEYLKRYNQSPPKDLSREIGGMSFEETAQYFKDRFFIPESIEEIEETWDQMAYRKYAEEITLKPGAERFLGFLKNEGIPVAIASSNSHKLISACLTHNHVEDEFALILTTCEVKRGKPAPDIYLAAANDLGVAPFHCLVFEDIPNGILSGKNAGMQVCAVEDEYSLDRRDEIRHLADYYIRNYDEIEAGTYEVLV